MNEKTENPPPETETRPRPQPEVLERSLAQAAAKLYVEGAATGAGLATGALVVQGVKAKVQETFAPKDEGSNVVLPPGVDAKK